MAWTTPRTWVTLETVTAAQLNEQIRDNLNMLAYQQNTSWSPTWGDGGIGPSIGNGTLSGQYVRIGRIVFYYFEFVIGTTSTWGGAGSGQWFFSLPTAVPASLTRVTGTGYGWDASTGDSQVIDQQAIASASQGGLYTQNPYTAVTATTPWTWDVGDTIRISGSYIAA